MARKRVNCPYTAMRETGIGDLGQTCRVRQMSPKATSWELCTHRSKMLSVCGQNEEYEKGSNSDTVRHSLELCYRTRQWAFGD